MYTAKGQLDLNSTLKQYSGLVRRLAHQMIAKLPANVEIDDLIQVGMIGLADALSRFDAALFGELLSFGRQAQGAGPDRRGQAPKGTGGMPRRHQMAGVEGRERSGGAAQRASIPEYPLDTRGTETSQYPQEQKSTETPSVAASERGPA